MSTNAWWRGGCLSLGLLFTFSSLSFAQPVVVNGDFESEAGSFVVWPGYVDGAGDAGVNPSDINGWLGTGGRGVNPILTGEAPFRDNGNNASHVAFLQGASSISQTVGGFTIGAEYELSLDFNARNCCGDFPIGTILLNGEVAGSSLDLFPDPGAIIPVGEGMDWYNATIPFTAPTESIQLEITAAPAAGGDATMLVDNVSFRLVPEPSSATLLLLGGLALVRRRR